MKKKRLRVQLPATIRGYADFDYLHKLNDSELEFMRNFMNKYYRAQFNSSEDSTGWDTEERRKSYARKNAGNRDCYTRLVDLVDRENTEEDY